MDEAHENWNRLVAWLSRVRARSLPPNMTHAWRVHRYADSVCNGGLGNFLSTARDRSFTNEELLQSLDLVGGAKHQETLEKAMEYRKSSSRRARVPKSAQIAKFMAYDLILKGASRGEARKFLDAHVQTCSPEQLESAISAATAEVEIDNGWHRLDQQFFIVEAELRSCIASFSDVHVNEWRNG